jgi:hypothetical protein
MANNKFKKTDTSDSATQAQALQLQEQLALSQASTLTPSLGSFPTATIPTLPTLSINDFNP